MKRYFGLIISMLLMHASTAPLLSSPGPGAGSLAVLTEKHGLVFKRLFLDQQKTVWDKPRPAQAGDVLNEGTQVATAAKSWAQIAFPNITARTWENSVVLITPNRKIVYLMGGQMLVSLRKDRPHKDDYAVWTKVLHIRFRGTTVLIKDEPGTETVTVLEGSASVENRLDHSVVNIDPGVALEVDYPKDLKFEPPPVEANRDLNWESEQNNLSMYTKGLENMGVADSKDARILKDATDERIYEPGAPAVTLFKTSETTSSLHAISAKNISQHPLLTSFDNTLASQALVEDSLTKLASKGQNNEALRKLIIDNSQIANLPKDVDYNIDPEAESILKISHPSRKSHPDGITKGQTGLPAKEPKWIAGSAEPSSVKEPIKTAEEIEPKHKVLDVNESQEATRKEEDNSSREVDNREQNLPPELSKSNSSEKLTLPSEPIASKTPRLTDQQSSSPEPTLPTSSALPQEPLPDETALPTSSALPQEPLPDETALPTSSALPQEPLPDETALPTSSALPQEPLPDETALPTISAPPQELPPADPTAPIISGEPQDQPSSKSDSPESSTQPGIQY